MSSIRASARVLLGAFAAAALAGTMPLAHATLNLATYGVTGNYALDALNGTAGGISGYEASAVAYARDRGTLFFVGDEGTGVVEISKTGQTLGYMNFDWTGTGSKKHDTEALTYVGNGQLVVGEERLYDAYKFGYVNGGTATLASNGVSISDEKVGNSGMEGISYDVRNGSFVMVKQEDPEDIRGGTLSFGPDLGGSASTATLFDPTLLGLATLSDIQTLGGVDGLSASDADNLLILSLGSNRLVETTRSGQILSSFDLTPFNIHNGIEGVSVDENGTIYLVAEQEQDGSTDDPHSRLIVLSKVPEPETCSLMLGSLGLVGWFSRRKQKAA